MLPLTLVVSAVLARGPTYELPALADVSVSDMAEVAKRPLIHAVDVLDERECQSLSAVWQGFSPYRPSSEPRPKARTPVSTRPRQMPAAPIHSGPTFHFASSLSPRFDAGLNFARTGGRLGRGSVIDRADHPRNEYFRETYATRNVIFAQGIQFLIEHRTIVDLAIRLYELPVVEPVVVYANLLLPGQELGLHTDIPEFRLAPGEILPAWLRVVMCHSGLFERWRLAVATVIVYLGPSPIGGALAYFPNGPAGEAATIDPREGEAVALDADLVFHGIDRVGSPGVVPPPVQHGSRVVHLGEERWSLIDPAGSRAEPVATYGSDQLRFSASWKACCFADEGDKMRWDRHTDDLPTESIIGILTNELVDRGRLTRSTDLSNDELGLLLVEEFVRFPQVEASIALG
jgi:hypothetical protein